MAIAVRVGVQCVLTTFSTRFYAFRKSIVILLNLSACSH